MAIVQETLLCRLQAISCFVKAKTGESYI